MKLDRKIRYIPSKLALVIAFAVSTSTASAANISEYNGPVITFEQIYANPDDQDLNLNYARQQAALGDYLTAAASLERMLYTQPNWDSARLFYALCLYHLDDLEATRRELNILKTRPLSADQRKLFKSYKKLAKK